MWLSTKSLWRFTIFEFNRITRKILECKVEEHLENMGKYLKQFKIEIQNATPASFNIRLWLTLFAFCNNYID